MKLAVMDMDSTLITIECIDEIAAMQGLKPQVAAITEAAMRGELDFSASLKRRVALLKGLPASALEAVYHERLQLSPGAQTMINGFRAVGIHTVLVSGGFTFFADRVRDRLQLDEAHSNLLGIANDTLTGEVISTIVDAQAKADHLRRACAALGCAQSQTIAIGDGANDLLMMAAAGVSVAYHAKPRVKAAASCSIAHNGLNAVLNLFTR
jgi:phosphoserine phosphatase